MSDETWGWGSPFESSGQYLARLRRECAELVQAKTAEEWRAKVTGCVLSKFTELDKSLFASRQYFLTLWPAFVGAIVAIAPDPSMMVYDNIWWSAMFVVTSGGLLGVDRARPPHHVEVYSDEEGKKMCETWLFDAARPAAMSRADTGGSQEEGLGYVRFEWLSLLACFCLWLAFCTYFGFTLRTALNITVEKYPVGGAMWYYGSAFPTILAAIFGLIQNRVDLYEPAGNTDEETKALQLPKVAVDGRFSSVFQNRNFRQVQDRSVLKVWLRILLLQWQRAQYRILVRDRRTGRHQWFFVIGQVLVGGSRLMVFTVGSIMMGNIILMPVPNDLTLFVLLLFTSSLPRLIWPAFWENGNRGADLVIWVRATKIKARSNRD